MRARSGRKIDRGDRGVGSLAMQRRRQQRTDRPRARRGALGFEALDGRVLLATTLTASEVGFLLDRAAAASASNDGIIAVVDRNGDVLGVRVESGVAPVIARDLGNLTFAVDG